MAIKDKRRLRGGDSGWEVEWCSHLPPMPGVPDEADMDNAVYETRDFDTREEALAFAREVYPRDKFGSVRITPFEMQRLSEEWPYGITREHMSESEFYEGGD